MYHFAAPIHINANPAGQDVIINSSGHENPLLYQLINNINVQLGEIRKDIKSLKEGKTQINDKIDELQYDMEDE